MASKQTYECYICKRNNFPGVRVYLDGKDENGKTIYKNDDMSPHIHKQGQQQQQQTGSTAVVSESTQLKIIQAKLDRIIAILEERLSPKDD